MPAYELINDRPAATPAERQIGASGIAELLGIPVQTVYGHLQRGRLPSRVGHAHGQKVYVVDVLVGDAFVESPVAGVHQRFPKKRPIAELVRHSELVARDRLCAEIVAEYALRMRAGTVFPPAIVYEDTAEGLILAEGLHRIRAAEACGEKEYPCFIRRGGRRAALLCALQANIGHGLRRRKGDVKRAVERALQEFPRHSNRQIALLCGASHTFVNEIRAQQTSQPDRTAEATPPSDLAVVCETFGLSTTRIRDAREARWALEQVAQRLSLERATEAAIVLEHIAAKLRRIAVNSFSPTRPEQKS